MDKLIDSSAFNNSDYEIASILYELFKNDFRYSNNNWEYYKQNCWNIDNKNNILRDTLKNKACTYFINRSIFWAEKTKQINSKEDILSTKLLFIGTNFKNDKYISNIIKECKQFFNND
jgi:hypothetical protein